MNRNALSSLQVCALAAAAAAQAPALDEPVRLEADGKVIDTVKYIGHSGPLFCDQDGDGRQDLLVGNFKGHVQVFRNVGTAQEPKFADQGLLQAEGKDVFVHNW
jgi:hypothetical protein